MVAAPGTVKARTNGWILSHACRYVAKFIVQVRFPPDDSADFFFSGGIFAKYHGEKLKYACFSAKHRRKAKSLAKTLTITVALLCKEFDAVLKQRTDYLVVE
jgi:hypothetical protein